MRSRLLVAAAGIPAVLIILIALPEAANAALVCVITLVAAYELFSAAGETEKPHCGVLLLCALTALAVQIAVWFNAAFTLYITGFFLFILLLFSLWVSYHERGVSFGLSHFSISLLTGMIIPLCLSGLVFLRNQDNGVFKVLIPFGTAFIGDAGALFCGMAFGRHKLSRRTSPKKTVEGALGGIAASALFSALFALVMIYAFDIGVNLFIMVITGIICGILAQLGDLAFSLIKRELNIKDYGKILRGHGGVLDRFDSMVTVAPAVALIFILIPPF